MSFDERMSDLRTFLTKWEEHVRSDLQLPSQAGRTLGISMDMTETFQLNRLPATATIYPGLYINVGTHLIVEVHCHDMASGNVTLEYIDPISGKPATAVMPASLFIHLFNPKPDVLIPGLAV